jgi:hypothetical protein
VTPLDLVEASPTTATLQIGVQGPAFEGLLGTDGKRHGFSTLADREVLVLIFSSKRCPTAKADSISATASPALATRGP